MIPSVSLNFILGRFIPLTPVSELRRGRQRGLELGLTVTAAGARPSESHLPLGTCRSCPVPERSSPQPGSCLSVLGLGGLLGCWKHAACSLYLGLVGRQVSRLPPEGAESRSRGPLGPGPPGAGSPQHSDLHPGLPGLRPAACSPLARRLGTPGPSWASSGSPGLPGALPCPVRRSRPNAAFRGASALPPSLLLLPRSCFHPPPPWLFQCSCCPMCPIKFFHRGDRVLPMDAPCHRVSPRPAGAPPSRALGSHSGLHKL